MANWNELASQQRRLSEERARAEALRKTPKPPKLVNKENPEYLKSVFKRFEQIGIQRMLEDINRTTAVWGNLGRIVETPPQFGNLKEYPRRGDGDVYECSSIRLTADYKHYELVEKDVEEMRNGKYTETYGGYTNMDGIRTGEQTVTRRGPHMETVGRKDAISSKDEQISLNAEIYYIPHKDGHAIVVTEWFPTKSHTNTSLATEMGNNPINSVFKGRGYEIVRGDKGYTTSSISYGLDHFAQNCVIFDSGAIALTFYADNFDINLITQFLQTAFAISIFLAQKSGQTIPAIRRKEEAERLRIEERVRNAPIHYFR